MRYIATTLLVFGLITSGQRASGQESAPKETAGGTAAGQDQIPKLPETEVIGEPGGSAAPAGPAIPSAGESHPVGQGGVFSSPPATGYSAPTSTAATLIDVPNLDVPATVTVVPEAVIEDQKIIQVDDLLRNIGGAVKVSDGQRPDAFFLRGFEVSSRNFRKDGFLDPTYTPRDFANVDRVEVLKGPASVLYGLGQPAGSVNFITKMPLAERMNDAAVEFGSYGLQRYTVDSTGPVLGDGSLLYRVNAAYQNSDSFRDYVFEERTFVAPALTWLIDSDTSLTWKGEFSHDRRMYDSGVAAVNGQLTLPISRFLGEPGNDFQEFHDYRQSLMLTHRIDEDWSWRVGGSSLFYDAPSSATIPIAYVDGAIPPLGNEGFFRSRQDISPFREQYQSVVANIAGKAEGSLVTHDLVVGTEAGWFTSDAFRGSYSNPVTNPPFPFAIPQTWLAIDGANPVYNNPAFGPPPAADMLVFDSRYYYGDYGVYFQDLMTLSEHWKVLAGVRYDHVDMTYTREFDVPPLFGGGGFPRTTTNQTFDEGSPRVGLIYEPLPEELSFYATYTECFAPPAAGPYMDTGPLRPELGQIWEGGIKMQPLTALTVNVAGFYITKENTTRYDPYTFSAAQVALQRSQGVEINAIGKVTARLSLLANYAYTDTLQRDANPALADINGKRVLGVPYNMANVWSRYNLLQCEHRTLGVGLGVVYVGERLGDYDSAFTLPAYTRWDAGVFYKQGRFDASMYLENLFDARYYTGSISQYEVFPGAPFNVRAQVAYTF